MAIEKIVVVNSFTAFVYELEEKIKQGYSLSTTDFPVNNLFNYEAFLEREIPDEPEVSKAEHTKVEPVARKPRLAKEK
jgi:hypothetical protein